jgi:pimeloyl-ACP methyl ester carboxylesterase
MGGAIAQTLALDHPDQVIGLGLIGSAARLRVNPVLIQESHREETFNSAIDKVISWSFSPNVPEKLKALVARRLAEIQPQVLAGDFIACDAYDITGRVDEIRCPTIVICGAEDRMIPVKNSQFLADHIRSAQLSTIPAAGHMVMLEKPVEVSLVLAQFLAAIRY